VGKIKAFNGNLEERLNDDNFRIQWEKDGLPDDLFLEDVDENENYGVTYGEVPPDEDYGDMLLEDRPEDDDVEDQFDKYIGMELVLGVGTGDERKGRVVKKSRDNWGRPIGRAHSNPIMDTSEYLVEMADGITEKYRANVIAENMFAQVDDEGSQFQLLSEIVDHKKDGSAFSIS